MLTLFKFLKSKPSVHVKAGTDIEAPRWYVQLDSGS